MCREQTSDALLPCVHAHGEAWQWELSASEHLASPWGWNPTRTFHVCVFQTVSCESANLGWYKISEQRDFDSICMLLLQLNGSLCLGSVTEAWFMFSCWDRCGWYVWTLHRFGRAAGVYPNPWKDIIICHGCRGYRTETPQERWIICWCPLYDADSRGCRTEMHFVI